jgi:hypothetical protein
MTRRFALVLVAGCLTILAAGCAEDTARKPLKQLYTPHYTGPPACRAGQSVFESAKIPPAPLPQRSRRTALAVCSSRQGFVLGFSLIVMLLTAFDFQRSGPVPGTSTCC